MTVVVVVVVVSFLVGVQETQATTKVLHAKSSSSSMNRVGDVLEVKWSASCSPRLAKVFHYQDAVLQCDMHAPAGSSLVWLKDEVQILPQLISRSQASRHLPPPSPEVIISRKVHRRRSAKVYISAGKYIDCASTAHQGNYTLRVTTPSQHVYTRNFTVILSGDFVIPAMTCYLGRDRVAEMPRVWQYARHALGKHSEPLLLPCRVEQGGDTTTRWYFRGKLIVPGSDKYKLLSSGDLEFQRTEQHDAGIYTCMVHNTQKPYLFDRVHTWVMMPKRRSTSP